MEVSGEPDFNRLLQLEEEYLEKMCSEIIALKPDLVITEKGVAGQQRGIRVIIIYNCYCMSMFTC